MITNLFSLVHFQQAFEKARCKDQTLIDLHDTASKELAQLATRNADLQAEIDGLKSCLKKLRATPNDLMKNSLAHFEQFANLPHRLPAQQLAIIALIRCVLPRLPTPLEQGVTTDDRLYRFLCSNLSAYFSTVDPNANALFELLHLDINPNPTDLDVRETAKFMPFFTSFKTVLMVVHVQHVYDLCGLHGLRRLLRHRSPCPIHSPCEPSGRLSE